MDCSVELGARLRAARSVPLAANQEALAAALARMPVLAGLAGDTLALLARDAHILRIERGEMVFRRGAEPTGLYFLVDGGIKLLALEPDGREKTIELFTAGRMFGEIGVFHVSRYRAWTQAVQSTRLIHVPQARVLEAVALDHELSLRMLTEVSARVQQLIEAISNAAPCNAHKRVVAYLLDLLPDVDADAGEIRLPAPKCTIASLLNLSSETFSRVLRRLRDERVIGVRGRVIEVRDRPGLAALLNA